MKTYLGDNLELADKDVLRRVGVDAGLDAKAIDELLASNAFEDTVIAEEKKLLSMALIQCRSLWLVHMVSPVRKVRTI